MVRKNNERIKAIALRRRGFSYNEILKHVDVAKSTIALWLQDVGLSAKQKQNLTEKRLAAARKGAETKRQIRLANVRKIYAEAAKDIDVLSKRELWLMGIMLYWAEGSKEKEWHPGSGVKFANSDPLMLKLFLKWLKETCSVDENEINFEIFIHENHKERIAVVRKFWAETLNIPVGKFKKVYWKTHKPKTDRKNTGNSYYGVLRMCVKASSSLNRKIAGWIIGINKHYWGVV